MLGVGRGGGGGAIEYDFRISQGFAHEKSVAKKTFKLFRFGSIV